MNSSTHEEHGLQPTPDWSRRADWERIVTSVCRIAFVFVAAPWLLLTTVIDDSAIETPCYWIAGVIALLGVGWLIWVNSFRSTPGPTPECAAFVEGQRLTRGELYVTTGCLFVIAFFIGVTIDLVVNHRNGMGVWMDFLLFCLVPAPFLTFGFASVVATHGKWKLTLAACGCFAASVILFWVGLFCLWD